MAQQTVKTKSLRGFENCRVNEIGVNGFAECLKPGPATCAHAVPFGYCFLCKNPRLELIIENTKAHASAAVVK